MLVTSLQPVGEITINHYLLVGKTVSLNVKYKIRYLMQ